MSYAGYVHGQSSSNISPRKLDQTRKARCFRGRGSNSCQVLYRRPKVYLSIRWFQPIWNFRWKKKQLNSKEFWSQSPRHHGNQIKKHTVLHPLISKIQLWSKQMAGGFPCSAAFEKKKPMISVNNLRNKFLLAGSPGSCKPESSEGVNFHPPPPPKKKREKNNNTNTTPFKANLVAKRLTHWIKSSCFGGASVVSVWLNTHLS